MVDDIESDEYWSTPLFQSFKELMAQGVPRSEVDQIILESQFGLGYGLKMRNMAESIVDAAEELFPAGIHAEVFKEKFLHHEILEENDPFPND